LQIAIAVSGSLLRLYRQQTPSGSAWIVDEEHEAEADRFAADQWIPPVAAQKL
jgi:hypothetical protein